MKNKKIHSIYTISYILRLILLLLLTNCKKEEINSEFHNPLANPHDGPPAGNPDGNYVVPAEAAPEDVSNPDHIIGTGTPESCTAEALLKP